MIGSRIGSRVSSRVSSRITKATGPQFVAAVGATFSFPVDFALATVTTPAQTRPGDTMLFIVITQDGSLAASPPAGFTLVASLTATAKCGVYRRIATGTELASYSTQLTSGANHATGALLVYRGLDQVAGLVGSAIADVVLTHDFACPSLVLTASTDLYIGIASIFVDLTTISPPDGTAERLDEQQVSEEDQQIEIFDLRRRVAGATGVQTAVPDVDPIFVFNGVAISLALKSA